MIQRGIGRRHPVLCEDHIPVVVRAAAAPRVIAAVIENQSPPVPIPRIVHTAETRVEHLSADIIERLVIKRRGSSILFSGNAPEWGVADARGVGAAGAITEIARHTVHSAGTVVSVGYG